MTDLFACSDLFGALFRDAEIAGAFAPGRFVERMLDFERAWTEALVEVGAVSEADAAAARAAMATVPDAAVLGAGSDRDGLPVPALVRALRSGLDDGAAAAIHTGTTSQDVLDTAMSLTLLEVADILDARLATMVHGLDDLDRRFGDAALTGRTRMQAALPITVGHRLAGWRRPLCDHRGRLRALRPEIARLHLGGPVGLGAAPDGQEARAAEVVARRLGLTSGPVRHVDRSAPVSFGHLLTLIAGTLGKIGQDVALMAQQGLDEIALAGGGGSSAMPHKQNPVLAETMVTLARYVAAQQGALAQAMIHEQERSGAAWALEWLTLPPMAEATGAALRHGADLLAQVERIGGAG